MSLLLQHKCNELQLKNGYMFFHNKFVYEKIRISVKIIDAKNSKKNKHLLHSVKFAKKHFEVCQHHTDGKT